MTTRMTLAARWRAAVLNVQHNAERVQATADELPRDHPSHGTDGTRIDLLRRHESALIDHMTAIACARALLRERRDDDLSL